ncbi:MAG: heterodisulfide reductase-related iron-sulfur binding cluster, partial [Aggregatilineales bacterium]
NNTKNVELLDLDDADVCCGFGGLFSVKMPAVSNNMLQKKVDHIKNCTAETIVTGDVSCMTQMNGGLKRQVARKEVRHIADVLADALEGKNHAG